MGAVVTTVRIDEDLLKTAKRYGIKISKATELGIQLILEKTRRERAKRAAERAARVLENMDMDDIVKIIREGRER